VLLPATCFSLLPYTTLFRSPNKHLNDLQAAPIYRGHPEKQMVAFLINVSWGEEHIPEMLKVLSKHKVKATFFIDGAWAQKNVDRSEEHTSELQSRENLVCRL